jgi:glycosyltransferase involved in cell wall biosynthesis
MKVALVHDWLTGMRGGEKVLESFCELYPEAPVYTLLHVPGTVSPKIESHRIKTSFLQHAPFVKSSYRNYLPLFPTAIESLDLQDFDLILSSSHCVAKGVIPPANAIHVSYCHTPMRYVWDQYWNYFGNGRVGVLKSKTLPFLANYLRLWDVSSSHRVNQFIANSEFVAGRIEKYYGRKAAVIYPPVDIDFFVPADKKREDFWLVVSALVPYKRIEIAIQSFNKSGKTLVIAGDGPEKNFLQKIAGPRIQFMGRVSSEQLRTLYQSAKAVIQTAEEDFGISVVEALACHCPVIAFARGGALETIEEGETGLFFNDLTPEDLGEKVDKIGTLRFNTTRMRERALRFSPDRFRDDIKSLIQNSFSSK